MLSLSRGINPGSSSILLQARRWLAGKVSLGRNGPIRITSFESSRCRSESEPFGSEDLIQFPDVMGFEEFENKISWEGTHNFSYGWRTARIRVSLLDSPVLRTPFSLLTIEITIFLFELYERTRSRSRGTNLLKTERKGKPIVRPGFRDFLTTLYNYNLWKRGEAPLGEMSQSFLLYTIPTKEKRAHSDREHTKQRKDWPA